MSYLQEARYKLQKRVQRLQVLEGHDFHYELKLFWSFIHENQPYKALIEELRGAQPNIPADLDALPSGQILFGSTESEKAAIALEIIRRCSQEVKEYAFLQYSRVGGVAKSLDDFRTRYLEALYEYLDERIDDRNLTLMLLLRFKHLAEWFRRAELHGAWSSDTRRGEKLLAWKLYEYLYEQGLDFSIEPTSASGEADMVASQNSASPLVADAKVFKGDSGGKNYIVRGFHQVYRYLCDYDQPIGYLVIFNVSEKQIRFALSNPAEEQRHVRLNNRTVFLVEIDIFPHREPASRRPVPDSIEISESELLSAVGESGNPPIEPS